MVKAPRGGRWLVLTLLVAGAPLAPGAARAALPVAVYPVAADDLLPDERADLTAILEAGLRDAARRGVLRQGRRLGPGCGPAPADACLAGLAEGGAVLLASAVRRRAEVLVTAALVDARGRRTRSVTFGSNLSVQNTRPVDLALEALEFELLEPPAAGAAAAGTIALPGAVPSRPPGLAAAPPRPAPAASARVPDPDPRWQRDAGRWTTAGGLALLGAGGAVAWLGARLTRDLEDRYHAGLLRPGDEADYRRARRAGQAATLLLVAGGLATSAGLTLWALAPDVAPVRGGATVGVAGAF